MTKNSEVERIGARGGNTTRGFRSTRIAGQRGLRFIDPAGNDVIAPEWQVIGATVSGDDDDTGVLTIGGGVSGGGTSPDEGSLGSSGGEGHVVYTNSNSGSALTLDLSIANIFDITLTANCTLTFSNPPADKARIWIFILRQDSTGSRTVTWPGTVQWQRENGTSGASAPSLFTTANAEDVFEITTLDGGVSYGGASRIVKLVGAIDLDDLSDVTITSAAADQQLQYVGGVWVNNKRRWEAVTNGEDVFVWDGTDLVHEWKAY